MMHSTYKAICHHSFSLVVWVWVCMLSHVTVCISGNLYTETYEWLVHAYIQDEGYR